MPWQSVKMFLTPLPIMISLFGLADKPDAMGLLAASKGEARIK